MSDEATPTTAAGRMRGPLLFFLFLGTALVFDFGFLARDAVPPILNDDWALHAELVWGRDRSPSETIREIFLMSWEGRPLRAVEYAMRLGAHRLLGLRGAFLVQATILALSALVLTALVGRRLPLSYGVLAGLLFLLHPADSTHAWLATMMAKLALLYTLLAILAFVRGRNLAALLLLVAGFMSYELSPLAFALAPWVADGLSRRSLRRGLAVFAGALLCYGAWRLAIFSAIAPDLRGLMAGESSARTTLAALGRGLAGVLPLMLVDSFLRSPTAVRTAGWALAAGLPLLALLGFYRARSAPTWRGEMGAPLRALLAGLMATLAGALLSFAAMPTADPGVASRHTIAALPGAVVTLCALIALLNRGLDRTRIGRLLVPVVPALLLALGGAARLEIQQDYREASRVQRRSILAMVQALGDLPPHSLVVIENPLVGWPEPGTRLAEDRAMTPLVTGYAHELEAILGLVYDRSIVGVALGDERDQIRARLATAAQIGVEAPPFHAVLSFDAAEDRVNWLRRPPLDPGEGLVRAGGPALDYLGR